MMDQIRVTVIATGFDGKRRQETMEFAPLVDDGLMPKLDAPAEDEMDIPAFLRKRSL
jgi:hypothetical protein